MKKGIYTPKELRSLYTHHPHLDVTKSRRIHRVGVAFSQKREVEPGLHISKIVLDTPPILVSDVCDGEMVLNGKHRGTSALYRDINLEYVKVSSSSDILHSLPDELREPFRCPAVPGDEPYELRQLAYFFDRRHSYVKSCISHGVETLEDHVREYELHTESY